MNRVLAKIFFLGLLINALTPSFSQSILNEISQESFDNSKGVYNYTYWKENFTEIDSYDNVFVNHSNDLKLAVDYGNLNFLSLDLVETNYSPKEALDLTFSELFSEEQEASEINYAILQNGSVIHEKTANPTNLDGDWTYSQMAEYGKWCNRRFVDSVNFTNSPDVYGRFTGVEFTNWHNRFKATFRLRPRTTITNGQLEFSIEIPSEFNDQTDNGVVYAFGNTSDKGFALVPGETVNTTTISGNTITVQSEQMNLEEGENYQVSIIFYSVKEGLSNNYQFVTQQEGEIEILATKTLPNTSGNIEVSYDADEGLHYVSTPRHSMGYTSCETQEVLQNTSVSLVNDENVAKRVRLCFVQSPASNVVGFSSMLRNKNGDPSGHHLQISKNWHGSADDEMYGGSQVKEYTEVIVPANTILNFDCTRIGAKWGETFAASSHQLSIVGYNKYSGQQWLEAALGSFGESICHSPDYTPGNSNVTDWRPFLVTNTEYGGTSSECNWTGNVGGIDFGVYYPSESDKDYQSEPTTKFLKYGPNLTETAVSFVSSDKKTKLTYTFFLNRSDDYNRTYYKVKFEALEDVTFSRYDFFQLGGDFYRYFTNYQLAFGNKDGLTELVSANESNTSTGYATPVIALSGDNPWVWAGDGARSDGNYEGINIPTNNGFVIRDYQATFAGTENNTPHFRERTSQRGGVAVPSYCIVPPSNVTSFMTGDKVEFTVEVMLLPKQAIDYYGTNQNFIDALTQYGNSWEILHREASHNRIEATSLNNEVSLKYPLSVATLNNTADVEIVAGIGYVPIVFTGLSSIDDPTLWKKEEDTWEVVDQSNHGKDFWQAEFNEETGLYDLIYNVNQDIVNDIEATISYYLGDNPEELSCGPVNIVVQSLVVGESWTGNPDIEGVTELDSVRFAPQVTENGSTSTAVNENWTWTLPDNSTYVGRVLNLYPVTMSDIGDFTVSYMSDAGCGDTVSYSVNGTITSTNDKSLKNLSVFPSPTSGIFNVMNAEGASLQVYNSLGLLLITVDALSNNERFDLTHMNDGMYVMKITSGDQVITRGVLKK